jgi:hypothetical protein
MNPASMFPASYADARQRFRAAAMARRLPVEEYRNPAAGPAGELLATDVVRIGPPEPARVLFMMSGTHGAEGFCGSGIQYGVLQQATARLPPATALLLIHAINPCGFAWLRRVTEDNVDLNRNHVDHAAPYPDNPGYRELREAICPTDWYGPGRAAAEARLSAYAVRHGPPALQAAISGGQYLDPEGVFFGGHSLTWSARTLYDILDRHAGKARHVGFIDLHTGLGPCGYGELISEHAPGDPELARLRAWLGDDVTSLQDGSASSAPLTGTNGCGIERRLRHADTVTVVTLEYGTFPLDRILAAVRADAWLHRHGEPGSAQWREIKAEMRQCFYPDTVDWKRRVWERAVRVKAAMLAGLATLPG